MEIVCENRNTCLICLSDCREKRIAVADKGFRYEFECDICGIYEATAEAYLQLPRDDLLINRKLRAGVSHEFKLNTINGQRNKIEDGRQGFEYFKNAKLPGLKTQLENILKFVGEKTDETGGDLKELPVDFHSVVGALDRDSALKLVRQLKDEGYLHCKANFTDIGLTVQGWETQKKLIDKLYHILVNNPVIASYIRQKSF